MPMEQQVPPSKPWLGAAIGLAITAALIVVLVLWHPSTLYLWLKEEPLPDIVSEPITVEDELETAAAT